MDQGYNLLGVIRTLLKWKNQILIVTVASGIITAIVSFLALDDYYKSYTTIYPINMAFSDRAAIFNNEKVDYYGGKDDVNRVLTIAQSANAANYIISKYNLVDHYKINKNKKYWRTKVTKEFQDNYKALKTDQGAIEISIYDTDPVMASNMISDVINFIDSTYRNLEIESKKLQLETFKKQLAVNQQLIDKNADTLADLQKQYKITIKSGSDRTDIIEGSDYKAVELYKNILSKQKNELSEFNYHNNIMLQIENSLSNQSKSISIIDAPVPADKKEKPMRSIIVALAVLITFVFSIFGVLLIDQIQEIRKQL